MHKWTKRRMMLVARKEYIGWAIVNSKSYTTSISTTTPIQDVSKILKKLEMMHGSWWEMATNLTYDNWAECHWLMKKCQKPISILNYSIGWVTKEKFWVYMCAPMEAVTNHSKSWIIYVIISDHTPNKNR